VLAHAASPPPPAHRAAARQPRARTGTPPHQRVNVGQSGGGCERADVLVCAWAWASRPGRNWGWVAGGSRQRATPTERSARRYRAPRGGPSCLR